MSSPIYIPPSAASFTISPAAYAAIQGSLHGDSRVSNLVLTVNGGSATVENVDFGWSYDGTANLVVAIIKKHGFFAEHYPNAAIFDALQKQLFGGAPYTVGQVKS